MKSKIVIKKKTKTTKTKTPVESEQVKKSRTIKEAIRHGRNQTNKNFRKLVRVILIVWAIQFISSWLSKYVGAQMWFWPDAGYRPIDFIWSIISMWTGLGLAYIAVHTNRSQGWTTKNLFPDINLLGKYIIAYVLMWCSILIWFALFIVPGIYIAYKLSFMQYYIVDQDSTAIQALKQSWHATTGHTWKLIWLSLLFVVINILWLLALGIGLLWTVPTTIITYAYVYEKIK